MHDSLRIDARGTRAEVTSGSLRGASLLARIRSIPWSDRDAWIDELLGTPDALPDAPDLPRGSVPYLPCGVDDILAMVTELPLRPADTLVDIGSGLGRVAILAHLLSGARAQGIELQAPLVASARAWSATLALTDVSFVHANAAEIDLEGSVFFFYAPFNGDPLRRVLRRLEALARSTPIVLCAVGLEFHGESWLRRRETTSASLTLWESIG